VAVTDTGVPLGAAVIAANIVSVEDDFLSASLTASCFKAKDEAAVGRLGEDSFLSISSLSWARRWKKIQVQCH
jgi:hypothetical protein